MNDLRYSDYVIIGKTPVPISESDINTIKFEELKGPLVKKSLNELVDFLREDQQVTPMKPAETSSKRFFKMEY